MSKDILEDITTTGCKMCADKFGLRYVPAEVEYNYGRDLGPRQPRLGFFSWLRSVFA